MATKHIELRDDTAAHEVAVDPEAGWVLVRALQNLVGGGRFVNRGETYRQPPEVIAHMVKAGWVEVVKE